MAKTPVTEIVNLFFDCPDNERTEMFISVIALTLAAFDRPQFAWGRIKREVDKAIPQAQEAWATTRPKN